MRRLPSAFCVLFLCKALVAATSAELCAEQMEMLTDDPSPAFFELNSARTRVVLTKTIGPGESFGLRLFKIYDKDSDAEIGSLGVSLNGNLGTILSIGIAENRRGSELGPEAEAAILEYLFTVQKAESVKVYIPPFNTSSIRAHKKLGFVEMAGDRNANYSVTPEAFREAVEGRRFGASSP